MTTTDPPVAAAEPNTDLPLRVTVLGAGRMGSSVAGLFLDSGVHVDLVCSPRQDPAVVRDRVLSSRGTQGAHRLVTHDAVESGADGACFVIECLPEDLDLKRQQLRAAADVSAPMCVLATNTSSFGVDAIAAALDRPDLVVGLHYLFPADLFPFVEVVRGGHTSDGCLKAAVSHVVACGQRPIVLAKDVPGTVINRLQFALIREAVRLVDDGVAAAEDVDYIVERGLAPRWAFAGPLCTAELGGAELFATIADRLYPQLSVDAATRGGVARRHLEPERLDRLAQDRVRFLSASGFGRVAGDSHESGM